MPIFFLSAPAPRFRTQRFTKDSIGDVSPLLPLRLTAEIGSFVAYIKPTREEDELRLMVIDMIRRVVQTQWPDADVVPFGSFGTKLYLPGGSVIPSIFTAGR